MRQALMKKEQAKYGEWLKGLKGHVRGLKGSSLMVKEIDLGPRFAPRGAKPMEGVYCYFLFRGVVLSLVNFA